MSVEDGDALEQGEMLGEGKAEIEQGEGLRLGEGLCLGDGQGWRGVDGVGGRGDDDGLRDRGRGLPEVTVSDVPDARETGKLFDFSSSSMETTLYYPWLKQNKQELHSGTKTQVVNIPNRYFLSYCDLHPIERLLKNNKSRADLNFKFQ